MEEQIKKAAVRVRIIFFCFWLIPVLIVLLGESGEEWVGLYAGDMRAAYLTETVTILLTALCIPVSLKLFSWILLRKIDVVTLPEALRLYVWWSGVRLALLAVPVAVGFLTYYMMWSSTGVLCALIGLTASFFCLPGESRLRRELYIDKEKNNDWRSGE